MNNSQLSRSEIMHTLEYEYGLTGNMIYLLDLIPLVEMLWCDGRNQEAEVKLIYDFTVRHAAQLAKDAGGVEVISTREINHFLEKFVHQRPSPRLVTLLRELTRASLLNDLDPQRAHQRSQQIINYCLDIAAAAVPEYPYGRHDRFMEEEKQLLSELMKSLHIAPQTVVAP